jgi:hypothetical protein
MLIYQLDAVRVVTEPAEIYLQREQELKPCGFCLAEGNSGQLPVLAADVAHRQDSVLVAAGI